jgi:hypothetical protein
MNKLTDLEICNRIGKIEGMNGDFGTHLNGAYGRRYADGSFKSYNPLTDDALIFRTAFEKKVKIDYFDECVYIASHRKLSRYRFDKNDISSLRKAICLVIIEDHK